MTGSEPSQRGISMVFQSYALFPHMTVRQNIDFGLRLAKVPAVDRDARVAKAADILHLQPLLDRKPAALSGGQRQRVAIGRSIVRNAEVFLFDEPLSNLDAALRTQLRVELAAYKLLIIDEIGFVPLSKAGAELLFELVSQRYERGATLITSNVPFDEWTETSGSERLSGALLDRITHHVNILKMNGNSYRLAQSRA